MVFFQNQATLYSNNGATLSNIATGEINEVLTVEKTPVVDTYTADGTVTYVITLTNEGENDITNSTLTDNMGEYAFNGGTLFPLSYIEGSIQYYQNGVLQEDPEITSDGVLTIEGITIPAGGNAMLIYATDITASAPLAAGSIIINEVRICGCSEVTAQSAITVEDFIRLSITKAIDPSCMNECGNVSYTFLIYNYGNRAATADDGIRLVDEFDPIINIEEVTLNGEDFDDYTYMGGVFTSETGAITVPAATITQNAAGAWVTSPGVSTLVITGSF